MADVLTLPARVEQALGTLDRLPTLPAVAARVVSMAGDEHVEFKDIAAEVEKDPALAASLLKVANSPYYRTRHGVSSVLRALVVLGAREVRRICLGVSVMSAFPRGAQSPGFDREAFWRNSSACAVACREIARRLRIPCDGEEFTAGLLHGVGKFLLDLLFHEDYDEAIRITWQEGIDLRTAEERVFGASHPLVGAWLCRQWKFPDRLVDAVQHHLEPERAGVDPVLASVVHLGELFARVTGSPFGGERTPVVVRETQAWAILVGHGVREEEVDLARLTFELAEKMEQHRDMFREAE